MDNAKLQIAIENFKRKQLNNPMYYFDNLAEQENRKRYYQCFTRHTICNMSDYELHEYISKLCSMLMWGNKKYALDKLIEDNGFEYLKKQLADLLFSKGSIEIRWDSFLKNIKGLGPSSISELLAYINPQEYAVLNKTIILCLVYLGVDGMPKYNYQFTGKKYIEVCNVAKEIGNQLIRNEIKNVDLVLVNYFLWNEALHLSEKEENRKTKYLEYTEVISTKESTSLHDEIKEKLVSIGKLLGFESRSEVKIASGAVVDAIWEAKIGNMGKAIYVFEVQSKGSIDSLILNLKRAQNNPAVQAVVAVTDETQINKIILESKGVIDEKSLRIWDSDDVLGVYDALAKAHESINKLALVPESF